MRPATLAARPPPSGTAPPASRTLPHGFGPVLFQNPSAGFGTAFVAPSAAVHDHERGPRRLGTRVPDRSAARPTAHGATRQRGLGWAGAGSGTRHGERAARPP